ncbi:acyl-CoA-binding protein isoform X2 [Etheostoma spectabile]|uniref:acyl-CoA-binding protein isoform X2 n=1 Tax=Etheostoma spectabile TaxID=54343 RepID=UPI0013AE90DF|nr:acyl-CoA-binding protein-like isoform X2 [Etheostoma spectabile]
MTAATGWKMSVMCEKHTVSTSQHRERSLLQDELDKQGAGTAAAVCQFQPAVMNESFEQAVEDVKSLKQRPGYGVLGDVYGLYKQATVGDVNIARPGMFDLAGRGKWDAWERRKGMSKEEAKAAYVKLVEELKKEYGF